MRLRRSKVRFNQKLVIDSIGAGIVVNLAPDLLNRFLFSANPISGMTGTAAGVAVNYLLAQFMNRPDMANVGIGVGLVQFVKPIIDQMLGTGSPVTMLPAASVSPGAMAPVQAVTADYGLAGYGRLNEYVGSPRVMTDYSDSY